MPGHNGGFNPFRDANGEFTDPGAAGKPGRSREGGPAKWTSLNDQIRTAAGRGTAGGGGAGPSASLGEARQPVRGVGVQFYQYPKSKYMPEAKAKGEALNEAEQAHARRLLAPGVRNAEIVAAGDGKGTMGMVTAMRRQRGGGSAPWLSYTVLDPATRGTKAEKWLEIPRGEKRDPKTGLVTDVVSEVDRVQEFVHKVNSGADFRETLRAFNGGQDPIDSTHFGDPMSEANLGAFEG
ncbi:hypothetical protein K2Z83_13380 [Oscillochloris sp. ZM17-4]|uniref:hypothetical protein n=1 Tax=Oscillochloris sp. ZM17-4 TaxID=2866714 RepID=UPI001C735F36|nr:hypothetical protein [Oscillochloris sp. ZM17-4]MBX0328668.1 hypothetical protein [Oscillochloris sp. ZM17-4]